MLLSARRLLLISRNFPPLVGGMERLNHHVLLELERDYAVDLVGPQGATAFVPHPNVFEPVPPPLSPGFWPARA